MKFSIGSKKKGQTDNEKKDLTQNYSTEDHKIELDVLLQSLGTNAAKVSPCQLK